MSQFKTKLPVDVDALLAKLPKGSFVHGIQIAEDKRSVSVVWEHEDYRTPYTVPVEATVAMIEGKEPFPALVKIARAPVAEPAPATVEPAPIPAPAPAPAPRAKNKSAKVQMLEVAPPLADKAKQTP